MTDYTLIWVVQKIKLRKRKIIECYRDNKEGEYCNSMRRYIKITKTSLCSNKINAPRSKNRADISDGRK